MIIGQYLEVNFDAVNEEKDDDNEKEHSVTTIEYVRIKALKVQ